MGIRMNFKYTGKNNTTMEIQHDVPTAENKTSVSGFCGLPIPPAENVQDLKISFFNDAWKLMMVFRYNPHHDVWYGNKIVLGFTLDEQYFPNVAGSGYHYVQRADTPFFRTSHGASYQCLYNQYSVDFALPSDGFQVKVTLYDVQVEAFANQPLTEPHFSSGARCPADLLVSTP